jgi:hypothetical protein
VRLAMMATHEHEEVRNPEKSGAYLVAATQMQWRGRRYPAITHFF